jgi:hypothetical protein
MLLSRTAAREFRDCLPVAIVVSHLPVPQMDGFPRHWQQRPSGMSVDQQTVERIDGNRFGIRDFPTESFP